MKRLIVLLALVASPALADSSSRSDSRATVVTSVTDNRGVKYPVNTAVAPSFGTSNGCALGGAGAASGSGFSISLGGSAESKDCLAQNAANMATSFADRGWVSPAVPVNVGCENSSFREGMYYAGTPCANDERVAEVEYTVCESRNGQMVVQIPRKANRILAMSQCRATLGIR